MWCDVMGTNWTRLSEFSEDKQQEASVCWEQRHSALTSRARVPSTSKKRDGKGIWTGPEQNRVSVWQAVWIRSAVSEDRTRFRVTQQVCQSHLSSAFTRGRRHPLIGWEGDDPSCCHSLIRSQRPHLHTGDLNPLQSVQRDRESPKQKQ